ncbi:MAG: terminase family protein [Pseudomonadota bacterium]
MSKSLLASAIAGAGGSEAFLAQVGPVKALALLKRARLLGAPAAGEPRDIGWRMVGRPEQLPPPGDDWLTWLILAGRGFGKTRSGAEILQDWVMSGRCRRLALIGPTTDDIRQAMVEGESGLQAVSEAAGFPIVWKSSKHRITWPNGAIATTYSAEEPDRLRNKQHDGGWCDELAAWDDPQAAWDQYQFGLRLGKQPRTVVTTTPRPIPIIRALIKDPTVVVTKGITFDNEDNLAPSFLGAIRRAYEGTRLGRQEMNAEILDDNPNALWNQKQIDELRIAQAPLELSRIAIAIDPAVSTTPDSDATGIIAAGIGPCHLQRACAGAIHAFVLEDQSGIYTPAGWAQQACKMYDDYLADRIVAEVNNGGDLVEANLRASGNKNVAYHGVRASRGKYVRAEPVAALYEQGKVHHVGTFGKLEDEMTQWDPISGVRSPDRMDALVWCLTDLMLDGGSVSIFDVVGDGPVAPA